MTHSRAQPTSLVALASHLEEQSIQRLPIPDCPNPGPTLGLAIKDPSHSSVLSTVPRRCGELGCLGTGVLRLGRKAQ